MMQPLEQQVNADIKSSGRVLSVRLIAHHQVLAVEAVLAHRNSLHGFPCEVGVPVAFSSAT